MLSNISFRYKFLIDHQGLAVKRTPEVNNVIDTFATIIKDVGKSFCDWKNIYEDFY